jgi:hypothetical protein
VRSKRSHSAWSKGDDASVVSAAADKQNKRLSKNGLPTGELDWKRTTTLFAASFLKVSRT